MFTFEYCFYPKTVQVPEIYEFDERMQNFIQALVLNGQILDSFQNCVKLDGLYAYRVVALERDSLEKKYWNSYCEKFYGQVLELSAGEPKLHEIGENYDVPDCCTCSDSSHFILLSEYNVSSAPIVCGDCLQAVPLYRLPKTYENQDYYDLLSWYEVYKGCDKLFMNGMGERYGYKMMHDPESILSKEGIRICRFLEQKTEKPFYYFLFQYYRKNKSFCPLCGEEWKNLEKKRISYDYVCQRCRMVSNDIV